MTKRRSNAPDEERDVWMFEPAELKAYVPALLKQTKRIERAPKPVRQDLLEKDVLLHLLLQQIATDTEVAGKLLFKGGTCLIKAYLDYPRFSVDLDFTWADPSAWIDAPMKKIRDLSREARHATVRALERACDELGLSRANEWIVWGRESEQLTTTATYQDIAGFEGTIKFQVNFTELLLHKPRRVQAHSLLRSDTPAALMLLNEPLTKAYARPVGIVANDAREIAAEKGRAILTRQAAKVRDILDLYFLEQQHGIRLEDHLADVEKKTRFILERASRYGEHMDVRNVRFNALVQDDVKPLLLRPIDMDEFDVFRKRAIAALDELAHRLGPAESVLPTERE